MKKHRCTSKFAIALTSIICLAMSSVIYPTQNSIATPSTPNQSVREVPSALTDWASWILAQHPEWKCPKSKVGDDSFESNCDWASSLSYSISNSSISFELTGTMLAPGEVPLPRSSQAIPFGITIKPAGHVIKRGEEVYAFLPTGPFSITGSFKTLTSVVSLPAPESIGLISMEPIPTGHSLARRDGSIRVEEVATKRTRDALSLTVLRRLMDGSPIELETLIQLSISGRSRMITLGKVIPDNALPVNMESPLPAQVTSDGILSFQAKQGQHTIKIRSFLPPTLREIVFQTPNKFSWPSVEIFAFSPNPSFRSVKIEGADSIHAESAILPDEWKKDAIYAVKSDSTLNFTELSRGEQNSPMPRLSLHRQIWWDFDGSSLIHHDVLEGHAGRRDRLSVMPGNHIGRAESGGSPILVTKEPYGDRVGIEIRDRNVEIAVTGKQFTSEPLLAHGWDETLSQISGTLHLPPSWQLITIKGASSVTGAWLDSWSLINIFFGILILIASWVILSPKISILLGVMILLTHGEFLAPRLFIVHLLLLLTWRRALNNPSSPWHKLNTLFIVLTSFAWLSQILTFEKLQLTQLLFPQLQAGTRYRTFLQNIAITFDKSFLLWPLVLTLIGLIFFPNRSKPQIKQEKTKDSGCLPALFFLGLTVILFMLRSVVPTSYTEPTALDQSQSSQYEKSFLESAPDSNRTSSYKVLSRDGTSSKNSPEIDIPKSDRDILEDKKLAAGPALPDWRWKEHSFAVNGPIPRENTLSIIVLSPTWTRILTLLRILVVAFLAVALLRRIKREVIIVLAAIFLFPLCRAEAQLPSKGVLERLESYLEKEICTGESCSTIESLGITVKKPSIIARLTVSSRGVSSVPIPGPISVLLPTSVSVDGSPASVRRNTTDFLAVLVPDGRHNIEAQLALPEDDSFSISIPSPLPIFASAEAPGWSFSGISTHGVVEPTIEFNRTVNNADSTISPSSLGNWFVISRKFDLGQRYLVSTTVRRLGDISRPTSTFVPLLSQERIVSGDGEVIGGNVNLQFGSNQSEISYIGNIPITRELSITASSQPSISEEWEINCSPILNCSRSGIPFQMKEVQGKERPVYLPFSGETIKIVNSQLEAIPGDTLSIDRLNHRIDWSPTFLAGRVEAKVRVTQQASLDVTLPKDAQVQSIMINRIASGTRFADSKTTLSLTPGNHLIELVYTLNHAPSLVFRTPQVQLSQSTNNLTILVNPLLERWILFTGGGLFGPSVVYWAKLIGVMTICLILRSLGFLRLTPFSTLFLSIGLTSLPTILLWIPLLWLGGLSNFDLIRAKFPELFAKRSTVTGAMLSVTMVSLFLLYKIIEMGLVLAPPMLIAGASSTSSSLRWLFYSFSETLPSPWIISTPIWAWRTFSLIWATWAVIFTLRWLKQVVLIQKEIMAAQVSKTNEENTQNNVTI